MSKLHIIILDNENNKKEEISIIKPRTYQELLKDIKVKLKQMPEHFEMFVLDKNNKEIKICEVLQYEIIDELLFIRDKDRSLSMSKQEIIDDTFSCICCSVIVKNENPYLCYKCQKIFHEKCLKEWDKKCKLENNIFACPNCRNQLPIEKWNKKLNHEDKRKYYSDVMNEIHKLISSNNMNNILNKIKDSKIEEFKLNRKKLIELIKKNKIYLEKIIEIFNNILYQINSINSLLKIKKNNNKLNILINTLSSNIDNTDFGNISKIFNDEFEIIKKYVYCNNKNQNQKNISEKIKNNYKIASKEIELNIPNKIQLNQLIFTFGPGNNQALINNKKSNEKFIQNKEEIPKNFNKNENNNSFKQRIIAEIKNKNKKEKSNHIEGEVSFENKIIENMVNLNTNFEFNNINDLDKQKENKNLEINDNIPMALTSSQINNIINMSNLPETFGSSNINGNKEEKYDYNIIDVDQKDSVSPNINNNQIINEDNKISQNTEKIPEEDYSIYFQNIQTPNIFDPNQFGEEKNESNISNIFQGSNVISNQPGESVNSYSHYEENKIPIIKINSDNSNYNENNISIENNIPIEYNYNYEYDFNNQQLNIKDNENMSDNINEMQNYTSPNNFISNKNNLAKVTKVNGEDINNNDMTKKNIDFNI